jgi:hypothetical protein
MTGDPRYKHIAVRHANTVMKHAIREDGSVNHIISYDPETGEYLDSLGGQGKSPDSAWSRDVGYRQILRTGSGKASIGEERDAAGDCEGIGDLAQLCV